MTQGFDSSSGLHAALDRGESLPSRWYTDPSITEREITHVFRKSWNYIGPVSQLTALGDYITGYAGGVPVVVVRNDRGLAGFVNVCRHRRHEVMKGRGNAKVMQWLNQGALPTERVRKLLVINGIWGEFMATKSTKKK